ncbi:S9 family peptidase [Nannocystis punicea]|uniref:S9 family peptidase n=1 Tax=Nannocystis punicea TaxID=2995304 RepID=A0ABY7GWQ5_9BACT|nr:S9 family peptidase [Nannocystis poenicansa]WAS91330.1 S9 family peptidase [Nannocystis poenicansa]
MSSRTHLLLTSLALTALACAPRPGPVASEPEESPAEPTAAAPTARPDATLVPRAVLFGNPDREAPELSPDGQRLLYLAPVDGVLNVWVGPAGQPDAARPITQDRLRGIYEATWSADGERVLYLQDRAGDENWHVHAVDPASGESKDLSPYPGVRAQIVGISPRRPRELLVGMNDRDPAWYDLYRVDLRTGARTLVHRNEQRLGRYIADDGYRLRFATRALADGSSELLAPRGKDWQRVFVIGLADAMTTKPIGVDAAGETLYLLDSRDRETEALVARDVRTGKQQVLAENAKAGVGTVLTEPRTHRPLAVTFTHTRQQWQALDPAVEADLAALRQVRDGDFTITSQTLDGKQWIVAYSVDTGPNRYYRYDRATRRADLLFVADAELAALTLSKMHPVVIPARDGLELVSYYTLPLAADPDGDGVPSAPVPLVLRVHGGPWFRDHWGFDPVHQWLANRGYAVMSVNFRGSTGFTKRHLNAGDHEWAGKMHDDLLDAVAWANANKISDPARVAIMGGSYGGYATLVGMTFTPDAFACGVDVVGPSNLETLLRSFPPYWAANAARWAARVGDVATEEGRALLRDRSPLHRVDKIQRPLLIGQGANDPRVKQAESDQIVAAMQAKGLPVTYVLYPDEGHGFQRPANEISFNAITEAFLARCLGGTYQPIGDDFNNNNGASLEVRAGAEHVPGLAEALQARGR